MGTRAYEYAHKYKERAQARAAFSAMPSNVNAKIFDARFVPATAGAFSVEGRNFVRGQGRRGVRGNSAGTGTNSSKLVDSTKNSVRRYADTIDAKNNSDANTYREGRGIDIDTNIILSDSIYRWVYR